MLRKQRDVTDGGTLTASEGSCGSAAPEGRVPLFSLMQGAVLARWKKGSRYNRREPAALLHREWEPRPPPSATRNDGRRRHTATEGSRGSAAPEGEPRPMLRKQKRRDWWRDSHCVRRELRLCCTGGESPPFQFDARRGLVRRKKGSRYNRREPAALLRREWEPRPPPSAQRNPE